MRSLVRAAVVVGAMFAAPLAAHADRELCKPGAIYRGKTIDFDMKNADVHDVFRMLAEIGSVNVVVADAVRAKVTMKLKRVPWDQVACTIAAVHQLSIIVDGNVLLVRPRAAK